MADSNTPPELVEVDLPAGKVKVDKATAEILIKSRDTLKDDARKTAEKLGAMEAEKKAAADAAAEAQRNAEIEKAAKAGEIEKIKALMGEREGKLAAKMRDRSLEAAIAKGGKVIPEAVADIAQQLRGSCRFDLDTETLQAVGADGKPLTGSDGKPLSVDALVESFVSARPWFKPATQTPGSGAAGSPATPAGVETMSEAEYNAAMLDPARAQVVSKRIVERKLVVK